MCTCLFVMRLIFNPELLLFSVLQGGPLLRNRDVAKNYRPLDNASYLDRRGHLTLGATTADTSPKAKLMPRYDSRENSFIGSDSGRPPVHEGSKENSLVNQTRYIQSFVYFRSLLIIIIGIPITCKNLRLIKSSFISCWSWSPHCLRQPTRKSFFYQRLSSTVHRFNSACFKGTLTTPSDTLG